MPKIEDIERIGVVYSKKLVEAGICTTDTLLKTGIAKKLILKWVNLASLYRIKGVRLE